MHWLTRTSWGLVATLLWINLWGCAPRVAPAVPAGIALEPGRYLNLVYRAPDFAPARATYTLEAFQLDQVQGLSPAAMQTIWDSELAQAWRANGLRVSTQGDIRLAGTIQVATLRGETLRYFTGRVYATLAVSGAMTRGDEVVFAFQDRLHLTSPVNPGPGAPKEGELLLRQAARTVAGHVLNELLLYGLPAEGR
jgi:hypothetical protein